MNTNEDVRLFISALTGLVLSVVVYWGAFSKNRKADPALRSARYDPVFNPFQLVWLFAILAVAGVVIARSRVVVLPLMVSLVLEIAFYYGALLLALPLLRKAFRPSTVAALWLLPNFLYLTCYNFMLSSGPKVVLPVSIGFSYWPFLVWGVGFLAVMGWTVSRHLAYRKELLRDAKPVTDPEILAIWDDEAYALGLENPKLTLVRSTATATPLSIGIWRKTTRVVLPERNYTPEELRLILRHELIHIRHGDPSTKLFLAFCQAACWFNPLMWFAMRRCADDLELGCDELVLTDADNNTRETYARLVLRTAGDERGFTTCLSVRAKSLRYRLRGIVSRRKKLVGGLLVGLLTAALLLGNGLVAVAYAPSRGEDVIFHGHSVDYEPVHISSSPLNGWFPYEYHIFTCTDVPALNRYLSGLTLYRLSSLYNPQGEYLSISMNNDSVDIRLYDHMVSVSRWDGTKYLGERLYYSLEPLDKDYLQTLLADAP